jgi:hypothetical protein
MNDIQIAEQERTRRRREAERDRQYKLGRLLIQSISPEDRDELLGRLTQIVGELVEHVVSNMTGSELIAVCGAEYLRELAHDDLDMRYPDEEPGPTMRRDL